MTIRCGGCCPSVADSLATSNRAAAVAIALRSWLMVVSWKLSHAAIGMSSNPDRDSGSRA